MMEQKETLRMKQETIKYIGKVTKVDYKTFYTITTPMPKPVVKVTIKGVL